MQADQSQKVAKLSRFLVVGKLDNVNCAVDEPVTGHLILKEFGDDIASIEAQLVRVETYEKEGTMVTEHTEVQNLQIADGNIPVNLELPIYVILPRYFSCASFDTQNVCVIQLNITSL